MAFLDDFDAEFGVRGPVGALSGPDEPEDPLQELLRLQRESMALSREQRNYQQKMFEEGRRKLEQQRLGPSRAEQLFALSAALAQPRRYKGFGATLENVMPTLGHFAGLRRQAEQQRAAELEALQQQYMQSGFAGRREELEGQRDLIKLAADLNKPEKRRTGFNPITGELTDMDTAEAIRASGGAPRLRSKAEYDALPPGAEFIAPDGSRRRKPGGPTGSAPSGTFPEQ